MVKLAVFGASGGTGRLVVTQALSAGHDVVAVVRRPETVALTDERLTVRKGDVLDADSLVGTVDGTEAVISALGVGTQREPTTLYSEGVANIVAAMHAAGLSRLIAISAAPAGPWEAAGVLQRFILFPILQRLFGATYDDMRRMEKFLTDSDVDWTVFRPPRLLDGQARGSYRSATSGPVRGASITRADLATAVLAAVTDDTLVKSVVSIAY